MKDRMNDLVERLAALEHDQWVSWSRAIAEQESISSERLARWKRYWVSYEELPDDIKEHDRKWARKVLEVVNDYIEKLRAELEDCINDLGESFNYTGGL